MPNTAKAYTIDLLSESNVSKNILPYYGLQYAQISQIKFKDSDKQRAVYKVDLGENIYCLKKVYFSKEDLLFVYSAVEWLFRCGIHVPRILPTKENHRYVNFKDMLFILTPWIEGIKCNYDNLNHVLDASLNLGKMHNFSKSFYPIVESNLRVGYEDLSTSLTKHLQHILQCSNLAFKYDDKFSKLFLQHFDTSVHLAKIAVDLAIGIDKKNLSKSLCHLDYVNKNIIFDCKNDVWVIDFDKCRMDYCIHDLSYFLRRLLKRDSTKWDFEIAINSLNLYEKVHPLCLDEYKGILAYLAFPQKYWKISKDYYNNIKRCNPNSFTTLLSKAVEKNESQLEFAMQFTKYIEDKFHIKL